MSPIPMPMVAAADDDAARWQAWERSYMNSTRRAAVQARIAFAIILTGTAVWLGLQLMSRPL